MEGQREKKVKYKKKKKKKRMSMFHCQGFKWSRVGL